ncbi:MAG: hypothetical protein HY079_07640, partial [Elusimicrobia bacterium]|nr:hypothetical protein [Elusimicrobiota bacterium]
MIDYLHTRQLRRTVGAAGIAFAALLSGAPAFAQFSAPYDPDFAPSETPAPAPAPAPAAKPAPEPAPATTAPAAPPAGTKRTFRLIERADPDHVLDSGAAPAKPAAPSREYSLERFLRVRDAVERGEEPGVEGAPAVGPGWTLPVAEVEVSTNAPKPPPPEVELPTYGTSLSVTGR